MVITNDSWQHRHHNAMREVGGGNGETRRFKSRILTGYARCLNYSRASPDFSVQVVSNAFEKKVMLRFFHGFCFCSSHTSPQSTMQRHRMIYSALSEEFAQGLHALSLKTKTEAEAAVMAAVAPVVT